MGVENFWRQLKHSYLHNHARPRFDLLVWILINKVTPDYYACMDLHHDTTYRLGRSKPLTSYQRRFKTAWLNIQKKPVSTKTYQTNVQPWTCNCDSQKYNCHHICKHLVHAVDTPTPAFWRKVIRRRVLPIYHHPQHVPKGELGSYSEPDGAITEGDDHIWSGDLSVLDENGGWDNLVHPSLKRPADTVVPNNSNETETRTRPREDRDNSKRPHITPGSPGPTADIIDLTMSSPPLSPYHQTASLPELEGVNVSLSDISAFDYGSEDEQQVDELCEDILGTAQKMEQAAYILRQQVGNRNRMWLKTAKETLGDHVSTFVEDINHISKTGKKRGTTWAEGKSQDEKRRARLAMGFMHTS